MNNSLLGSFEEIELYESYQKFILAPKIKVPNRHRVQKTQSNYEHLLIIDRHSQKMEQLKVEEEKAYSLFKTMKSMTRIYGLLGVVELLAGSYLVVVLEREFVGFLHHHKIYLLKKIQLIPFTLSKFQKLSNLKKSREISYIEMIHQVYVLEKSFYFSYTFDLTRSIQDQRNGFDIEKTCEEFFYNKNLSTQILKFPGYALPMIRGYVEIVKTQVNKKIVYYGVISRVGCKRVGTRYNCRGADLEGNVANYTETEQFLTYEGKLCSFVEIRGSIPLLWTQFPDLRYTPEIKFSDKDPKKHREAFIKHFTKLIKRRGKTTVVNLTKESSHEQVITETFGRFLEKTKFTPEIKYVYFNFHHETKGLNMDKTNILLDRLKDTMVEMKYYCEDITEKSKRRSINDPIVKIFPNEINTNRKDSAVHISSDDIHFAKSSIDSNEDKQKDSLHLGESMDTVEKKVDLDQSKTEEDLLLDFDSSTDSIKEEENKPEIPVPLIIQKEEIKIEPMTSSFEDQSFLQLHKPKVLSKQNGIFRVNCIDCCDRTNVVETYIARKVLRAQFIELGILIGDQKFSELTNFNKIINHVWANNGDAVSRLYAGTTALMGDYTRSGERTISGLLNDGYNSAMRYVQNNFRDSDRQRSIDLSLGILDIHSKAEEELQKSESISDMLLF